MLLRALRHHALARVPLAGVRWRSGASRSSRPPRAPGGVRPKFAAPPRIDKPRARIAPKALLPLLHEHVRDTAHARMIQQRVSGFLLDVRALAKTFEVLPPQLQNRARVPHLAQREATTEHYVFLLYRCWAVDIGHVLGTRSVDAPAEASVHFGALHELCASYDAYGESALTRACLNAFLTWIETHMQDALSESLDMGVRPSKASKRTLETSAALRTSLTQLAALRSVTDLRTPELAYPMARTLTRQIHLHVGPTNSGKTHGALTALARARTGIYAGPLRLLAHEVWERLNEGTVSPGIPPRACNLKTGEEMRVVDPLAGLVSCTVEMADPTTPYDVAVIDEIQMIGDLSRGAAWTQAVLGLTAKEMHICGEASVVPLIKSLAELCGDHVHVHEYERLTPLSVAPRSLEGDLTRIQRGDCVVAFSRTGIFRLKQQIESKTKLQCAVAYGALPPETKSEQAKLFNSGKLDVMVASDAIGMGLNLRIKRIVFDTLSKWNGETMVPLSVSQIKQIAGRAGRYGTQDEGEASGLVLTKDEREMGALRAALAAPAAPITRAVIQPTSELFTQLSFMLPCLDAQLSKRYLSRPFDSLYQDVALLSQVRSDLFILANFDSQCELAPVVEHRSRGRLTHLEKEKWTNAPVNTRDERIVAWMGNAVEQYARGELVEFELCAEGLGTLEAEADVIREMERAAKNRDAARSAHLPLAHYCEPADNSVLNINTLILLESHHRSLTLYLWLSFRFPLAFCYQKEVQERKMRTEEAIQFCLEAIRVQRAKRLTLLGRSHDVRPEQRSVVELLAQAGM